jgi:hypothetical protein
MGVPFDKNLIFYVNYPTFHRLFHGYIKKIKGEITAL